MTFSSSRKRHQLLQRLEASLEVPMFFLAFLWLWLLIKDLTGSATSFHKNLTTVIWLIFLFEFLLKMMISLRPLTYLKENWLKAFAILIPVFRVLRLFNALSILGGIRVFSGVNFVRALTTGKRVVGEIKEAQGDNPEPVMNVGILLMHSLGADKKLLKSYVESILPEVKKRMEKTTGLDWNFNYATPVVLNSDEPHRASDFLGEASLAMSQGPFDAVIVLTDVTLMTQQRKVEAGLPSELCRVTVLSSRKLMNSPRGMPMKELLSDEVKIDGINLLLNMFGYMFGLKTNLKSNFSVMRPIRKTIGQNKIGVYEKEEEEQLRERFVDLPERELHNGSFFTSLMFHIAMTLRHPMLAFRSLLKSRAFLLPFGLPSLATAAVAPTFLLIFTAEIWDVGISMANSVAIIYAVISIVGSAIYLMNAQSVLLPRRDNGILTEHLAVANTVLFVAIFLGLCSLFVIVFALMMFLELYIFPADLMVTWQTTGSETVTLTDKLRLAAFIATIGVTTGALAGGFDSKAILRNLRLFKETDI